MLLAGLADTDKTPQLTSDQITQLINQKSKVQEYIHKDREREFELLKTEGKNKLHYLYVSAIGITILSAFVLIYKPEYFSQLLQAVVTTLGGYGLGKYQANKDEREKD